MSVELRVELPDDVLEELARRAAELVRDELGEQLRERKPWLTLAEAGERLGCSPDAVRMRARRGRLEHRYQGRRMYVSAEAVDRV
jgi:excisionase family DNA binding protein